MAYGTASEATSTTPKQIYNWRSKFFDETPLEAIGAIGATPLLYGRTNADAVIPVFFVGACACSGALMFGYNLAVIGGCIALPSFHRDFNLPPLDAEEYSYVTANIVSAMQGGAFFGSLGTFPITERWGRRLSLTFASMMFFLGSAIMTFSNGSLPMMYGGRFIGGLGVGSVSLLVPMYISEISPPDIRGMLVGMWEIGGQLSGVVGFWINFGVLNTLSDKTSSQWMISLGLQLVPGGMLFLASLFILPESPRFHVEKHQPEKALKTLVWLRQLPSDHGYIVRELGAMQEQVDRELVQTPSKLRMMRELFWKGNRNRVAMGVTMFVCQQMTGINAMNFYTPSIFRSIGFTGTSVSLFASGIWAIVKTSATVFSLLFLIDRLGRRKLLIIGACGIVVTTFYIGSFITIAKVDPQHPGEKTAAGWIAIVSLYIYAVFFCIAWNSVPWIYCAEIFPSRLRSLCVSITTATQWIGQFGIARASPYMLGSIRGGTYFVFGGCTVVTAAWVWGWVPETKGVALENMDLLFGVPGGSGREGGVEGTAGREREEEEEDEEEKQL